MLELTNKAISHAVKVTAENNKTDIRIGLKKTGCAGYEYVIDWCKSVETEDHILDYGKFKIIISNESLPYLENSTLDYVTDGINTTFKLLNPNETGSCGCGISVSF